MAYIFIFSTWKLEKDLRLFRIINTLFNIGVMHYLTIRLFTNYEVRRYVVVVTRLDYLKIWLSLVQIGQVCEFGNFLKRIYLLRTRCM